MDQLLPFRGHFPAMLLVTLVITPASVLADVEPQSASAAPEKLSLWPGQAPVGDGSFQAADPCITVYRPAPTKANGAAVVICPGGGYRNLVVGPEGHGIAQWLPRSDVGRLAEQIP